MKKTKRNHAVNVVGHGQKKVAVHIDNGTMTLDQAARLALDIAKVVNEAQDIVKPRLPCPID